MNCLALEIKFLRLTVWHFEGAKGTVSKHPLSGDMDQCWKNTNLYADVCWKNINMLKD